MSREKIIEILQKHHYKFVEKNNKIIVKPDSSLDVEVEILENRKVNLKDKLTKWNCLTGIWDMSIKNSIFYSIGLMMFTFIFPFYLGRITEDPNKIRIAMIVYPLIFSYWIFWTAYFLMKKNKLKKVLGDYK